MGGLERDSFLCLQLNGRLRANVIMDYSRRPASLVLQSPVPSPRHRSAGCGLRFAVCGSLASPTRPRTSQALAICAPRVIDVRGLNRVVLPTTHRTHFESTLFDEHHAFTRRARHRRMILAQSLFPCSRRLHCIRGLAPTAAASWHHPAPTARRVSHTTASLSRHGYRSPLTAHHSPRTVDRGPAFAHARNADELRRGKPGDRETGDLATGRSGDRKRAATRCGWASATVRDGLGIMGGCRGGI